MGHFLNLFSLILLILISNHFFFLIVGSIFVHSNFFSGLFSKRRNTVNFMKHKKVLVTNLKYWISFILTVNKYFVSNLLPLFTSFGNILFVWVFSDLVLGFGLSEQKQFHRLTIKWHQMWVLFCNNLYNISYFVWIFFLLIQIFFLALLKCPLSWNRHVLQKYEKMQKKKEKISLKS